MTTHSSDLDTALNILRSGGLVGLPTETVYGLAGDARRPETVAAIYALKNRPGFNPLIAHVSSVGMAEQLVSLGNTARKLIDAFWPGPLTLVLPVAEHSPVCDLARAGLNSQAIRCPNHPMALKLIESFNAPLVAPSANKSGRISPTQAAHVEEEFGSDLDLVLDGGATVLGLESTVVAILNDRPTLLRAGALEQSKIENVIGPLKDSRTDDSAPRSPGMLSRHYAPNATLRLNVLEPEPDEGYLGFGLHERKNKENLSKTSNLTEAAANLYQMLRLLDKRHSKIAIAPIPEHGLGDAINDRLRRAAKSI